MMNKKEKIIHALSWLAYGLILFYSEQNRFPMDTALIQTGKILGISLVAFYMHLLILLPRFLAKRKFIHYGLSMAVLISLIVIFMELGRPYGFRPKMNNNNNPPKEMKDDPNRTDKPDMPRFREPDMFSKIIFLTTGSLPIILFSTILWLSEENRKRRLRERDLLNENLKSEMRFLKSQINPHFLFNALNNIYSLSVTNAENAPTMILKLSEMLRHVVYQGTNKVNLGKEIAYINNFIDFQRLKIGEEVDIRFNYDNASEDLQVEPMMLIPFVENSFKHSDIENNEHAFISIHLETKDYTLYFTVKNTINTSGNTLDKTGGVGIENVVKRLELTYPGKSTFSQSSEQNIFTINLTIQTQ